jgi:DNA repair protein RecO (recombination protein O)
VLYRDEGVVLRTYKLGEADRIVVLCTRGRGKVRAVAKGVRKTKSKFGSRLEPTSHVALQLYQGRELDIVTQVESIDHFRAIRDDLDRLAKASSMLEVVDQIAQEGEANPRLFQMLVGGLRALADRDSALVLPAFFWKLLSLEGYGPILDACADCGSPGPLVAFDLEAGGALCADHRRGVALSPEALELLRRILGGQLGAALNEPASPATHEVSHLATRSVEHHLERRLKSATVLDRG